MSAIHCWPPSWGTSCGVQSFRGQDLPSATIVICAYNDEKHIAEKIRNVLALDYPKDRSPLFMLLALLANVALALH